MSRARHTENDQSTDVRYERSSGSFRIQLFPLIPTRVTRPIPGVVDFNTHLNMFCRRGPDRPSRRSVSICVRCTRVYGENDTNTRHVIIIIIMDEKL